MTKQINSPDRWVIIKITHPNNEKPFYKVLGTWYGGFTQGDAWKMNSGIVSASIRDDDCIVFEGYSGSSYVCHVHEYGTSTYSQNVLNSIIFESGEYGVKMEIMPEETDFISLDYSGVNY